jgi:hypothetical protein
LDERAIVQSRERLATAKQALGMMKFQSPGLTTFDQHWAQFLSSFNTIFSKLEQGAKKSGRSNAWFGRLKNLRRNDPLLRYLHHARNQENHGLNNGTSHLPFDLVGLDGNQAKVSRDTSGRLRVDATVGDKVNLKIVPPRVGLISVRDSNVDYDPPREHLGRPLAELNPVAVAEAAILFIENTINDAEGFVGT